MDDGLLILVGTVTGAVVGAGGALASAHASNRAARREREEDRRRQDVQEVRDAGVAYLRSVEAYVAAIQSIPLNKTTPTRLDRIADRMLGDVLNLGAFVFQRLLYGYRWERLLDDVVAASARLRVVAPAELRAAMDRVHSFVAGNPDLRGEGAAKWREVREQFTRVLQSHSGIT